MKKRVACPVCGARLVDSDDRVRSELKEKSRITADWDADYFMKCHNCGKEIGVKKIG